MLIEEQGRHCTGVEEAKCETIRKEEESLTGHVEQTLLETFGGGGFINSER